MILQIKQLFRTSGWFVLAFVLLLLALIYTAIFSTGILLYPTLHVEQWLVLRPITRLDCVFQRWSRFGAVDVSSLLTFILGIVCLALGYRWRTLPYLVFLLFIGVGLEIVGKSLFPQPIPAPLQAGLLSLACPQIETLSHTQQQMVLLGMWWKAPIIWSQDIRIAHSSAYVPFIFDKNAVIDQSYPSGHAMRWSFLGVLTCWLVHRHVQWRPVRFFLMTLALIIAVGGGLAQFYIAYHLITDLTVGYLLGVSTACCAIGLLLQNQKRR